MHVSLDKIKDWQIVSVEDGQGQAVTAGCSPPSLPFPIPGPLCRLYTADILGLSRHTLCYHQGHLCYLFDHGQDAEPLFETLDYIREDCLFNLGMADPPNPSAGFYYNVYIHHGDQDLFPDGWALGQGTDPYGFPFLTVPHGSLPSHSIYHEGFHIFQYRANSPGSFLKGFNFRCFFICIFNYFYTNRICVPGG